MNVKALLIWNIRIEEKYFKIEIYYLQLLELCLEGNSQHEESKHAPSLP